MTPSQLSALESLAGRALTQGEIEQIDGLLPNRQDGAIAAILSVGRTKLVPTEVGAGTILETLGLAPGNAPLDVIASVQDFRHVKPLVEQGRLRLDSALVIATMQSLVGTVLTQPQADALVARATEADPIPERAVTVALNGAN